MLDRSAKSMKPARIQSFYGNFGAGNLGNECTLQAVVEQTLRRWPNAQMLCFCTNPKDVQTRHKIAGFSPRKQSRRLPRHAFASNVINQARPSPLRRADLRRKDADRR